MNTTEGIFTGTCMYHRKYSSDTWLRVGERVACVWRLYMYIDIWEAVTGTRYCVNHEPNNTRLSFFWFLPWLAAMSPFMLCITHMAWGGGLRLPTATLHSYTSSVKITRYNGSTQWQLHVYVAQLTPCCWKQQVFIFSLPHWRRLKYSVEMSAKLSDLKLVSENSLFHICRSQLRRNHFRYLSCIYINSTRYISQHAGVRRLWKQQAGVRKIYPLGPWLGSSLHRDLASLIASHLPHSVHTSQE